MRSGPQIKKCTTKIADGWSSGASSFDIKSDLTSRYLYKLNRVAQLALIVVNVALRGADIFVPCQRLYHPYVHALVG